MARRAKLIQRQKGQTVQLPQDLCFEGQDEVSIDRRGGRIILEPVRRRWSRRFLDLAGSAPDFPYPDEPSSAEPGPGPG